EAARLPLEQEQFDRQQHGGQGGAEGRRHAPGRPPGPRRGSSSVLRSAEDMWKTWAKIEPNAPPVMMMGPSAPNGPPEPMDMAQESGLRTATRGDIRAWPVRMASISSGMPWPRQSPEPSPARTPPQSPPAG